ncbi:MULTISPECIES: hypothetical protein [Enorma]|uniref:hypothetical protein n=1 Tax=Enorma TaxID=1472762 RepID=UPI0003483A50|nr:MULTISPECIES: hypothetical protein [Enorma]
MFNRFKSWFTATARELGSWVRCHRAQLIAGGAIVAVLALVVVLTVAGTATLPAPTEAARTSSTAETPQGDLADDAAKADANGSAPTSGNARSSDGAGKGDSSAKASDGRDSSAAGSSTAGSGSSSSAGASGSAGTGSNSSDSSAAGSGSSASHTHSWKNHTATRQVWVSNMVTVPDYETQTVYGARFYTMSGDGTYVANGPTYWFENGFTTADLQDIIRTGIKNADENGLYNGVYYANYQNVSKTVQVQVGSHQEDQGHYETESYVDYQYCSCGARQ